MVSWFRNLYFTRTTPLSFDGFEPPNCNYARCARTKTSGFARTFGLRAIFCGFRCWLVQAIRDPTNLIHPYSNNLIVCSLFYCLPITNDIFSFYKPCWFNNPKIIKNHFLQPRVHANHATLLGRLERCRISESYNCPVSQPRNSRLKHAKKDTKK